MKQKIVIAVLGFFVFVCSLTVVLALNVKPVTLKRNTFVYEYGEEITIGDDVWVGGNATILPGAHIGTNVVIGAGSVVTGDIPDGVVAAGNPCRIIRKISEQDKQFGLKKKED